MAVKTQNDNPAQSDYDEKFNDIKQVEASGTMDSPLGGRNNSNDGSSIDKVKDAEENPDKGWKNRVTGDRSSSVKSGDRFALVKKRGPLVAILVATFFGGGAAVFFMGGVLGPIAFIDNVTDDLNDQLSSLDQRAKSMMKNKIPAKEKAKTLKGCNRLSIRCKFRTMSKKLMKRLNKAGIKVNYGESTVTTTIQDKDGKVIGTTEEKKPFGYGDKTGTTIEEISGGTKTTTVDFVEDRTLLGRFEVTSMEFDGDVMGPREFSAEMKVNRRLMNSYHRAVNMVYRGFSDSAFVNRVLARFGISRKPPELKGSAKGNRENRVKALLEKTQGTVDDLKFVPAKDADGNEIKDKFVLEGDTSPAPTQYDGKQVKTMEKSINSLKSARPPGRMTKGLLKGLSVLGYTDMACTIKNMIGSAAVAVKVANSYHLAKFAGIILPLVGQLKSGDISSENAEAVYDWFMSTDKRKEISDIVGGSSAQGGDGMTTADMTVENTPNPNYGKSAMDSDLYRLSQTGELPTDTAVNSQFTLGLSLAKAQSWIRVGAGAAQALAGNGPSNWVCKVAQNWIVRGIGFIVGVIGAIFSGGSSAAVQIAVFAGVFALFLLVSNIVNKAVKGAIIDINPESSITESPVDMGAATWTGMSVIEGEAAKIRGMMPANADQIVAYNQLQNKTKLEYIAMESEGVNPLDITSRYSFLGRFIGSVKSYFGSSKDLTSSAHGVASLISNSLASAVIPRATYATTDINPERFHTCDDEKAYKKLNINPDVQCNVRYIMPAEDLALDTDAVAEYMEVNGYVEPNTTTGLPQGYTPPKPSEAQSFASNFVKGFIGSFYNSRSYGSTDQAKMYGKYLDYCVYRAMPFGETFEETGAFGSAEPEWVNGSNCTSLAEPFNYFRTYTFDLTVNSNLEEMDGDAAADPAGGTDPVPADTLAYCSANYGKYTSQADLKAMYGSSASAVSSSLAPVNFPFVGGTKTIQVHIKAAPCFKAVAQALATVTHRPTTSGGTYIWRTNSNNASVLSLHSFGIAIDLDVGDNPNHGGTPPNCTTNMPADFVDVWKKYGFRWGGNYSSTCDAMHFEWLGGIP